MPSLTATGWRVKWGRHNAALVTSPTFAKSQPKSQKNYQPHLWLSTHHIVFTQALASAAFGGGVCASLSPERPRHPDRTLEMASLDGLTGVYLRAGWLAHLGEGIWVTRGPGLQKPPWGSPCSKRTLNVPGGEKGQLQLGMCKIQGQGLEERR